MTGQQWRGGGEEERARVRGGGADAPRSFNTVEEEGGGGYWTAVRTESGVNKPGGTENCRQCRGRGRREGGVGRGVRTGIPEEEEGNSFLQ